MFQERSIQQIRPGKWPELEALNEKYNAIEGRLGFPPRRRFRCYFGGHHTNTLVIEREWDSLAVMEATYMRAFMDPEWQALDAERERIAEGEQVELYLALP